MSRTCTRTLATFLLAASCSFAAAPDLALEWLSVGDDSGGDITAIIAGSGINITGNGAFGDATVNVDGSAFWSTSGKETI